jgi:hypothetical protein
VAKRPIASNFRYGHATEIPSGDGIGNARSLAKMYAATIGKVGGVRRMHSETIDRGRSPQTDLVRFPAPFDRFPMPHSLRFALGYEINRSGAPTLSDGSFGHSGAGGRLGFVHPETGYGCRLCVQQRRLELYGGPRRTVDALDQGTSRGIKTASY